MEDEKRKEEKTLLQHRFLNGWLFPSGSTCNALHIVCAFYKSAQILIVQTAASPSLENLRHVMVSRRTTSDGVCFVLVFLFNCYFSLLLPTCFQNQGLEEEGKQKDTEIDTLKENVCAVCWRVRSFSRRTSKCGPFCPAVWVRVDTQRRTQMRHRLYPSCHFCVYQGVLCLPPWKCNFCSLRPFSRTKRTYDWWCGIMSSNSVSSDFCLGLLRGNCHNSQWPCTRRFSAVRAIAVQVCRGPLLVAPVSALFVKRIVTRKDTLEDILG